MIVKITKLSEKELEKISKNRLLSLSLEEMKAIQNYFKKKKREPTDVELETIAQTWSEHCKHKTFNAEIEYYENGKKYHFKNLFKETIVKVTNELNKKWCVSVFRDNAGIIKFDDKYNIAFKVETHNHPSAIEPYGGASTGIGGVIRDILGAGKCAKPIFNTDVFCFAPLDYQKEKIPKGVLSPSYIFRNVVYGVRDYGNRMGIPTINGAIIFHESFLCNPLVYCGTCGIIPKNKSFKKVKPNDLIVLIGGRTGRDGIHGATFSSSSLKEGIESSVVQIGNPIVEKKVLDALLIARDNGLYNAITDCGAGGLSSAVGEMGKNCGAKVELSSVLLKYKGLLPWEIWLSEAQERMVLAVPKKNLNKIMKIFNDELVEAIVIGKFTNNKKLEVRYKNKIVCNLDMNFLHNGIPKLTISGKWTKKTFPQDDIEQPKDIESVLIKLLSSYTISSKEWVIRQYDHEVQGGSVIKPLIGISNDGPSDASVVRPILNSKRGIAVSNGINPLYSQIDTYHMATSAIDESLRNIVCVGGDIDCTALLDNFCWHNVNDEESIGLLVRAVCGCYDAAKGYRVPFISGKDSLNNEFISDGKIYQILPTLLISAICVIPDITKCITSDFKHPKNLIYVIGMTYNELGGSHYFYINKIIGNDVPKVNPKLGRKIMKRISSAIRNGLIVSCHDCSEGGIGVALSEMSFSGGYGVKFYLKNVPKVNVERDDYVLFSESNTRFIVEVPKNLKEKFEKFFYGLPFNICGEVTKEPYVCIYGLNNKIIMKTHFNTLKKAWQKYVNIY
jgi:phosphoribosylformylglycinamidine synthase